MLRRAENVVNEIKDNTLIFTMDRPPTGLRLEGIINSGDSGSPALIKNPDTGLWNVGGVASWTAGYGYESSNGYTRLGGIAYDWVMKNLAFDKETGKPKPWVKIADDKCELFKPEEYVEPGND